MNIRKIKMLHIFILFIVQLIMIYVITPLLLEYFFDEVSFVSELFALLISFVLPILLFLILLETKTNSLDEQFLHDIKSLYKKDANLKSYFLIIIIGILLSISIHYFFHLIEMIYILITDDYSIISILPKINAISLIGSIIVLIIIPPIFEELLYRD